MEKKIKWKIKGLADDHPAQKDFNEYMQNRKGEVHTK